MAYREKLMSDLTPTIESLPTSLRDRYKVPYTRNTVEHELLKLASALTLWKRGVRNINFEDGKFIDKRHARAVDVLAEDHDKTVIIECERNPLTPKIIHRKKELRNLFHEFYFVLSIPYGRVRKEKLADMIREVDEIWLVSIENLECVEIVKGRDDIREANRCRAILISRGKKEDLYLMIPKGIKEFLGVKENDEFLVELKHGRITYQRTGG